MIKGISATFKSNCKKDKVKLREYIIIDNKQVDIKGKLSATAYKNSTFFGTFNMKMLKFETENDINYKKKEFVYYKEVDGEAIKIGTFIVTDVTDSDTFESVNVTAYDYGLKLANPYTTKLDYSSGKITLLQQIKEICTNCDIELENTSLPNGTFIVDSNQFVNGEQYGDVIAQASGINGMFATINSNDKLEFIFQNETDEIIEDYVELDDKRDTHPITSVLVATSEDLETAGAVMKDENLIAQYGEHWLKIYSYGYAYSTKKCQDLVSAIFNQVKGFGYSSFKSKYSFLPYLSLGDKIQFRNKEGNLVNSIILKYETNYDNIILEAPSIINASVEYELPETPENIAKKAMITVNQSVGEIRGEVTKVESKVEDITTTTQTSVGKNSLYLKESLESNALEYSIDGKCEQSTSTQGKNYYTGNKLTNGTNRGITYTFDNSILKLNGTSSDSGSIVSDVNTKINIPAGTYAYSMRKKSGSFTQNNKDLAIYLRSATGFITGNGTSSGLTLNSISSSGSVKKIITVSKDTELYIRIFVNGSGLVCDNLELEIQIEPGSSMTDFEQFVPNSPSPDYPSEIKTIKGIRNLLNSKVASQIIEGITFTHNDDGTVRASGTTGSNSANYNLYNNNFDLKSGTYTLSGCPNGGSSSEYYIGQNIAPAYGNEFGNGLTFTINSDVSDKSIWLSIRPNQTVDILFKPMLEQGTVAHSYVPYGTYEKIKVTGKNWFDKDNTYTAIGEVSGYVSSDYIPVKKGDTINKTNSVMFWFYDKSKNQIGFASGSTTTTVSLDNVAYVRCNVLKTDLDTFMLTINQELTEYEPYKEKEVLIDLSKENLFDKDNVSFGYVDNTTGVLKQNGISSHSITNDTISFIATANYRGIVSDYISVDSLTNYVLNCVSDYSSMFYIVYNYDNEYNFLGYSTGKPSVPYSFTTLKNTQYIRSVIEVSTYKADTTVNVSNIKIYKGTNVDDSYELSSIGDTKDTLDIVNGQVVIDKKIDEIVLDGTQTFSLDTSNDTYTKFTFNLVNNKYPAGANRDNWLCSHFKIENNENMDFNHIYIYGGSVTGKGLGIIIESTIASTIDKLKTFLQEQYNNGTPVVLEYELAEPQQIVLPNINIELYEGINHITLVDDLETTTSIKYLRKTPISGEYALNQDLNKTNSNLADTNNQLSQTQSDIDNTKTNLNNNYYNKEQVDSINSTTTQNITQIRNTMEQNITSTNASISKIQEEITNGVSKVTTTTGTFDENGLNISKSGQPMSSTLDWDGLEVVRDKGKATETEVLTVRSAGVEAENMTVRNFFIEKPIRIEKCKSVTDSTKVGLGFFWIGE